MHVERCDTELDFYGWAVMMDDEVIGSVGLLNVDSDIESSELGASLGSKWWGSLITEAVGALINLAFNEIGMHCIYGPHHKDNIGLDKVMMKNGMKKEGVMRDAQKIKMARLAI